MNQRHVARAARIAAAALVVSLAAACTTPAGSGAPDAPEPDAARGYPGFDTALYPGDSAMRAWRSPASPYRWVGYYLQAPCHRDASWAGTRERLTGMGWGLAVIYVGQQVWEGSPDTHPDSTASGQIICSRTLLSAARGRQEADDAIARAAAEGFPAGTIVYLDIEPMTAVPDSMRTYYRAWAARLLEEGRYRPGVYLHGRNMPAVVADLRAVYADAGVTDAQVPVWLAQPDPAFSILRAPTEAGAGQIRVWQGLMNVTETWGGVPLRIDANVADRPSPSAP